MTTLSRVKIPGDVSPVGFLARSRATRWVGGVALAIALWLALAPAAWALTPLRLFDIGYRRCPEEIGAGSVTSGGAIAQPANCFLIYGKAENASNKPVIDADVFGRIYDADGNPTMENRTRIGAIEQAPPGISDFEFRISVPASQPEPLLLKQLKASGFTARVR